MSTLLANVTRGPIVESKHHGSVAVSDGKGRLIAWAGEPDFVTYMRSAAKPIQALNVLLSKAAEQFALTDEELAIICSSHYGQETHRRVIHGILDKIGLSTGDLLCGTPLSINVPYMQRQLRENLVLEESNSDCSGKHSGFLAVCKAKGYSIANYNSPAHPMQQELLAILAYLCNVPQGDIAIGIDGCEVPVHGFPLRGMATAYARLSTPGQLEEPYRSACKKIFTAMNAHPEMIAGEGGFCTEFLRATQGRFCAKVGAEAVYCVGVKEKDMGIAVKIEDGNFRALYPVVMRTLMQLELLSSEEIQKLRRFLKTETRNDLAHPVGEVIPCFQLEFQ